jgi:hypothetical protein
MFFSVIGHTKSQINITMLTEGNMTEDNKDADIRLPYSALAKRFRPYRWLLCCLALMGIGAGLFFVPKTNNMLKSILVIGGFALWGFFLISFWFDPHDGRFTRPIHPVVKAIFFLYPWLFAFGVTVFIAVLTGMLFHTIITGITG